MISIGGPHTAENGAKNGSENSARGNVARDARCGGRGSLARVASRAISSAAAAIALFAVGACGPDDPVQGTARDSAVIELVLRSAVLDDVVPEPEGELPLIYVVRTSAPIPIDAQAAVAAAVLDEAVIRFADDVTEAVDIDLARQPVLDDGHLLIFGEMPERGRTMTFVVTRYLDAKTTEDLEFTLLWSASGWSVQRVEML